YRGWKVAELPPNGQGIAALLMLRMLERFPLGQWGFHSARTLHAMIEAKKLAYADLLRYVGDPRFAEVPVGVLLSDGNVAARARLIDPRRAAEHVEPSHVPGITTSRDGDTIFLAVADAEGNIVSLIQSNYHGFGSGLTPKGCGFVRQSRGSLFTLAPGHQIEVRPPRTPNFGYGQAVLFDRKTGVKFGASDPRHDGQAIPAPPPDFAK